MESISYSLFVPVAVVFTMCFSATDACAQDQQRWTDTIALKGDLRLRYEAIDEDGERNRGRGRFRARFGLSASVNDDVQVVFRLATGADNPVSRNQTFGSGFSTKDIGFDLAYVDWTINDKMRLFGGKMKNPLFRSGSVPLIWDSDLNPEGIAIVYTSGQFFGTIANFAVEERSSSDDSSLTTLQGGFKFDVATAGKLTAGIGYYKYTNTIGNEPFHNGNAKGNTVDVEGNLSSDYNEFEIFAQYETQLGELPLTVFADFVQNSEVDINDTGYAFGIKAGKAKVPGSWEAGWAYQNIEADAVIGTFNDSDFGGGGTDATGHILKGKYALNKNVALGGALFVNEVEENAGTKHDYLRFQLDVAFKF